MDRMTARAPEFAAALRSEVRGTVREAETLARYSTYRIGGPATVLHPARTEDVGAAVRFAAAEGVPWFALGLGSNLLLPDEGLDALVIRLGKGLDQLVRDGTHWTDWRRAPGSARRPPDRRGGAGGAAQVRGRARYGRRWGVHERRLSRGRLVRGRGAGGGGRPGWRSPMLERREIPFSYRRSGLEGRIVVEALVALRPEDPKALTAELAELFRWRQEGTPFNQPCCGSVFQNPGGASWKREGGPRTAGQLIEAAGLKGFRVGGAEVSPMHANYFVNTGEATAADVRGLIAHVQRVVEDRFGARLETEVKLISSTGAYLTERER